MNINMEVALSARIKPQLLIGLVFFESLSPPEFDRKRHNTL